jgi:hypothetical protein
MYMDIKYIQQTIDLKDFDDGAIIVFGNFSLIKNTFHLERWQRNQMDRQELVDYFLKGDAVLIEQRDGMELYKHVVGEDCIYRVSFKTKELYIIA